MFTARTSQETKTKYVSGSLAGLTGPLSGYSHAHVSCIRRLRLCGGLNQTVRPVGFLNGGLAGRANALTRIPSRFRPLRVPDRLAQGSARLAALARRRRRRDLPAGAIQLKMALSFLCTKFGARYHLHSRTFTVHAQSRGNRCSCLQQVIEKMARPERFELPTFWFVGIRPCSCCT